MKKQEEKKKQEKTMDETKEKIYYGSLDNVTIEYGRYYCVCYGDGLSCRSESVRGCN